MPNLMPPEHVDVLIVGAGLRAEIRLPTEFEWERAARWTDGREYPYAGKYAPAKANTRDTGIGQTSAVGIFPDGASVEGVHDLSGNVWEWCLNKYDTPEDTDLNGTDVRVLRGGSWNTAQNFARAAYRNRNNPDERDRNSGFRVVCAGVPI